MSFDINDRLTWDWVDNQMAPGVGDYRLDPMSPNCFYQMSNGTPYRQACPSDQVFDPRINACNWPQDCSEADVYDWAVSEGLVNDQR